MLSTIFLCVPGVIYNLEKYRQIKCAYGLCLIQMASGGGPMEGCEKTYKVQLCLAVYGEVFNFIPYGRSMQSLGKFFEILSAATYPD